MINLRCYLISPDTPASLTAGQTDRQTDGRSLAPPEGADWLQEGLGENVSWSRCAVNTVAAFSPLSTHETACGTLISLFPPGGEKKTEKVK